jgi:hypothetical protein
MSIEEVIRRNKPDIRDTSVVSYVANVRRVMRNADETLDVPKVVTYLDSLQPHIAEMLASALNAYKPELNWIIHRYRSAADLVRESRLQRATTFQKENWTTLAAFRRALRLMRRNLKQFGFGPRHSHRLATAYFAWSTHMEFPMRNDLCSVQIVDMANHASHPKKNYYVLAEGAFHLKHFKTSRSFGRRGLLPLKLKLPKQLHLFFLKFLKKRKPSKWFISQVGSGNRMSKHGYRNLLNWATRKYLGVTVGSTTFRHIYLTEFEKRNPSLTERRRVARNMQQLSIETQHAYALLDVGDFDDTEKAIIAERKNEK